MILTEPIEAQSTEVITTPEPDTRTREVWPRTEAILVERALRLFARYDVAVGLVCQRCEQGVIAKREDHSGLVHLHCACAVRVQEKAW